MIIGIIMSCVVFTTDNHLKIMPVEMKRMFPSIIIVWYNLNVKRQTVAS